MKFLPVAIVIILLAVLIRVILWFPLHEPAWIPPPNEDGAKMNPRLFETLSFGHLPAAVDWLWMRAIFEPAMAHVVPGTHPRMYYDLDLASDLDPAFYELYFTGGNLLSVVRNDGPGARDLLIKGTAFVRDKLAAYPVAMRRRFWPEPAYLPALLGYVYLFELNDLPGASDAFSESAKQPGAPWYLLKLADRLQKPGGIYEVGTRLLNFMIESQKDPKIRAELEKKRDSVTVLHYLYNVNADWQAFGARDWERFKREKLKSDRDPFGGTLSLSSEGKITTTTPYSEVFGLK
jgi:hypothetical protein